MLRNWPARVFVLTLGIASSILPCSIITIGGPKPVPVRTVTGSVVGSGRIDLMGMSRNKERRASIVRGATVSLRTRKDIKVIVESELPPDQKWVAGALAKWECEKEVAHAKSDAAGNFAFENIPTGTYCLEITGPSPRENEMQMSYTFVINVADSAPAGELVADLSPRWPDCSGGESISLKTPK